MRTFEASMEEARRLISKRRDLGDIDIAEVARKSGLVKWTPRLQHPKALGYVRVAIGQVRAARHEGRVGQ